MNDFDRLGLDVINYIVSTEYGKISTAMLSCFEKYIQDINAKTFEIDFLVQRYYSDVQCKKYRWDDEIYSLVAFEIKYTQRHHHVSVYYTGKNHTGNPNSNGVKFNVNGKELLPMYCTSLTV